MISTARSVCSHTERSESAMNLSPLKFATMTLTAISSSRESSCTSVIDSFQFYAGQAPLFEREPSRDCSLKTCEIKPMENPKCISSAAVPAAQVQLLFLKAPSAIPYAMQTVNQHKAGRANKGESGHSSDVAVTGPTIAGSSCRTLGLARCLSKVMARPRPNSLYCLKRESGPFLG